MYWSKGVHNNDVRVIIKCVYCFLKWRVQLKLSFCISNYIQQLGSILRAVLRQNKPRAFYSSGYVIRYVNVKKLIFHESLGIFSLGRLKYCNFYPASDASKHIKLCQVLGRHLYSRGQFLQLSEVFQSTLKHSGAL